MPNENIRLIHVNQPLAHAKSKMGIVDSAEWENLTRLPLETNLRVLMMSILGPV